MPRTNHPTDSSPDWLLWPIRAIAVVVVLPFRLLGMALSAIGGFLYRYLIRPLLWLWEHLVVIPLAWLWKYLVAIPVSWLWRTVLFPSLSWLGNALVKLIGWILAVPVLVIGVPVMWLWEHALVPAGRFLYRWVLRPIGLAIAEICVFLWKWIVAPVGRALLWFLTVGWQGTSWLFRQVYRYLLRPVGIAIAFTWHWTVGAAWRTVIVPASRWLRDEILRPTGAAIRSILTSLGLR
jgi:hypothetical protein